MPGSVVSLEASQIGEVRLRLPELLPQLRLRALKLCHDPELAQDLVQETALRALSFEGSYKSDTNLKAWLGQILFSIFVTRCRSRRRAERFLVEHGADPNLWCSGREMIRPDAGLSRSLQRAIRALPQHFGQVVVLVDLQDMSYDEAANELGVPIGTVMSRLHRGRRLLAGRLAPGAEREAA